MNHKTRLIECLIKILPPDQLIDTDSARIAWFHNIRRDCGMRLSDTGFELLAVTLRLEYHEFVVQNPDTVTMKTLIDLDKFMTTPFYVYIKKRQVYSIAFFDEGSAVTAVMYDDLVRFVDSLH